MTERRLIRVAPPALRMGPPKAIELARLHKLPLIRHVQIRFRLEELDDRTRWTLYFRPGTASMAVALKPSSTYAVFEQRADDPIAFVEASTGRRRCDDLDEFFGVLEKRYRVRTYPGGWTP